jgi:chemotaxis protein MotA
MPSVPITEQYGNINSTMDKATWFGLVLGFGGILLANSLDGGELSSLAQGTAAVIVLAGTFGAVLVSNSSQDVKTGFKLAGEAFGESESQMEFRINDILECARTVRKESVLALEPKLGKVSDPFLREVLRSVSDGTESVQTKDIFEAKLEAEEENLLSAAKIWSDAGGFAPTIGIIGAVLGLIHVMGNLADTSKLGAGIAVAFVSTIYGVGFANLLFIPLSNKIKKKVQARLKEKRILLEGGILVGTSMSPILIAQKLRALCDEVS